MKKIISKTNKVFLVEPVDTDACNDDCIFGRSLHMTTENSFLIVDATRIILKDNIKSLDVPSQNEIDFFNFVDSQKDKEIPKTKRVLEEYNLGSDPSELEF